MKVPDKIYIAETPNKLIEIWSEEQIEPKPYITEHEYIRKDVLMEWIQEARAVPHENAITRDLTFQEVVNKLNSM